MIAGRSPNRLQLTTGMPPRVVGKKKTAASKRKAKAWHRHLPWLIPVGACVVFVVLIVGAGGTVLYIDRK